MPKFELSAPNVVFSHVGRVAKELLKSPSNVAPESLALRKILAELPPALLESALKKIVFPLGLAVAASLSTLYASPPATPSPAPYLELIATDGGGVEKHLFSHSGVVDQLVVKPNQAIPVTLQFPADKAGTPVAVGSLDGGEVAGGKVVILPTGKLIFTFRGQSPGLYRLLVQLAAEQYRLQIFVIDPNRPRNPRLRTAN